MEKETYKTAKELLETYEPTHPSLKSPAPRTPMERSTSGGQLRRRVTGATAPLVHPSQLHSPPPHQRAPVRSPLTPHPTNTTTSSAMPSSTNSRMTPATPTSRVSSVTVAGNGLQEDKQQLIPPGTVQ